MKNYIFFVALILFGCADSAEKKELDKLRASIRIIKSLRNSESMDYDPNVFNPDAFPNNSISGPAEGEREKMEESAKRSADSISQ